MKMIYRTIDNQLLGEIDDWEGGNYVGAVCAFTIQTPNGIQAIGPMQIRRVVEEESQIVAYCG